MPEPKDIRMEHSDGLGREAQVWVDNELLTVCDSISTPDAPCPPGVLENVKFSYASMEGFSWDHAVRGNAGRRTLLEPVSRWAYAGYGRVLTVTPTVVIDFGVVRMEDSNWTTDESLVGRFVRIPIDRLEITPAHAPDWPEEMR